MEFCPDCGSRLGPKKIQKGAEVIVEFVCTKCGYTKPRSSRSEAPKVGKVFMPIVNPTAKPSMTVITEEDQKISTMSTIKMECDKCGNNLVYVWQVQTRGGDEASTQFMRCTKCGHTFREYT